MEQQQQVLTGETTEKNNDKRQLILSHRNLRELDTGTIAAHSDRCIEYLDLSHNRITNLNCLYDFPHLQCLIMDDNRLREAHLEKLKLPLMKITTLTLNKNELSDLGATAKILATIFPNLQYLSLHGNPMCPDELLLQPFSEFVPYEYNHYRTTLSNSLPHLKFLDHFSLDSLQRCTQTFHQPSKQQHDDSGGGHVVVSLHTDLWTKLKSFLSITDNGKRNIFKISPLSPNECVRQHCESGGGGGGGPYRGMHSEGNRFITNSDL